jgi:hypothetical protein
MRLKLRRQRNGKHNITITRRDSRKRVYRDIDDAELEELLREVIEITKVALHDRKGGESGR